MANNLWSLFDDRLKSERDLVASDPQNLESISANKEEQDRVVSFIKRFETVEPKIDYSDFSNFVFFNSALDYFNITGEKILNEYPFDGSVATLENFTYALDGYQRHVLNGWPSNTGHLKFEPSNGFSYMTVNDVGISDGVYRSTFLGAGTGSMSIEMWVVPKTLTGSNDAMVLAQKITGSNADGYTVFLSGSNVYFNIVSGSEGSTVSTALVNGQPTFLSFVYDKTAATPLVSIYTGSVTSFPVIAASATSTIVGAMPSGPTNFTIGSGSVASRRVVAFTGSIDQVTFWSSARSLSDVSSSFNTKLYAQKDLVALWRFNESGSIPNNVGNNAVCLDSSGHRLNGRLTNYYGSIRSSGSILPFDKPDPILFYDAPEVQLLVAEQQMSGTLYDRANDNIITNLLPDKFFELEQYRNTTVLQNFLYIIARQFDFIKQRIDQFVKVTRVNYGQTDQAPDALLSDIARFFGCEFTGNFLSSDAFQYILGKNVLQNVDSNKELDVKLYEIKNEFWKRTLLNLMYIYKTKGTKESVEALLRTYGVNKNFVRLKEYGYRPNVGLQTFRIHADKSERALTFGSGSYTGSLSSSPFSSFAYSVESTLRFPTSVTSHMTASILTGSIWKLTSAVDSYHLFFVKNAVSSQTGSLILSSSNGQMTLSAPIFNDDLYYTSVVRDPLSGTLNINVKSLSSDIITYSVSSSSPVSAMSTASIPWTFQAGAVSSPSVMLTEFWGREMRVWDKVLSKNEMEDHTLNYQSYGVDRVEDVDDLSLRWKLHESLSGSADGSLSGIVYELSKNKGTVTSTGWKTGLNPYQKFLFDYNYIASTDFGWNEDKIRVLEGASVNPADAYTDNQTAALEFNMIDALNEDISQVVSTIDSFNNSIGLPVNRYRETYQDLVSLRRAYFSNLQGRLNFRLFADMLEFFDRSFVEMIKRVIPARVIFLGDEFVVESHMLERPKLQWAYHRQQKYLVPEGFIKIYTRT